MPSLKSATKPRARKGKAIPAKVEHEMTPAGFAEGVLGMNLYSWQKDTLNSLFPIHARTALVAANGSGKTSNVIAPALVWHMVVFENSLSVVTASIYRDWETDRKSTRLNSSHSRASRMPSSA